MPCFSPWPKSSKSQHRGVVLESARVYVAHFPEPGPKVSANGSRSATARENRKAKVVALPVKDPFHIVRALALALPVLERLAGEK